MPRPLKGDIVLEYLRKFPKTSNRGLATKIYEENKLLFKNIDNVRSIIRSLKGQHGKHNREEIKHREFYGSEKWDANNPFGIPASEAEVIEPYIFDKTDRKVLMLS